MSHAFQTSIPSTASTTMAAASKIVASSALTLGDDHNATLAIVATRLGKFTADEVDDFVAEASDPATAARIICAALEDAASAGDDAKTVQPSVLATPLPASVTAQPDMGATPMSAMLTMIKTMLPMVERLVELEEHLVGHAAMSARLSRLEQSVAALSRA